MTRKFWYAVKQNNQQSNQLTKQLNLFLCIRKNMNTRVISLNEIIVSLLKSEIIFAELKKKIELCMCWNRLIAEIFFRNHSEWWQIKLPQA